MTMRLLLTGVFGGIAMFIWTSIAHMVLPLGEAGVREMPNESAVLPVLQANLGNARGLYIFPGPGVGPTPSREQRSEAMKHMEEKIAQNPSGILMYHPPGREISVGSALGIEFATELLEAVLAVWLLSQTRLVTFGGRVIFLTVTGILAAIATNISYWNWYGFPKRYIAAYIVTQVVGFFVVGFVAAFALRKQTLPSG